VSLSHSSLQLLSLFLSSQINFHRVSILGEASPALLLPLFCYALPSRWIAGDVGVGESDGPGGKA